MVFRRRVKCYNPINDTFAITNFFGNQFYANNENDLRSKNLHKSSLRSTLIVMIYEKGFKHTVPRQQKWISTYNTTHHLTDITRCERVWVCGRRGGGLGGKGRSGIAHSQNRSDHKIVKYPPSRTEKKRESDGKLSTG